MNHHSASRIFQMQATISRFSHTLAQLQELATAADGLDAAQRHQKHSYAYTSALLVVLAVVLLIILLNKGISERTKASCKNNNIAFLGRPTTVLSAFAFWWFEVNPPQVGTM
jgi:surface polysaccharide O-acyltransferase-like enzyme